MDFTSLETRDSKLGSVAAITLALFYLCMPVLDRSAGVLHGMLVLLGLVAIAQGMRNGTQASGMGSVWRRYWPLILATIGPLLAVLANELSRGQLSSRAIDAPSRLALFVFVLLAVTRVPLARLRMLQWAFVLASFLVLVKMYLLTDGGTQRYSTDFIPMITFSQIALILGCFSIFSLAWNRRGDRIALALKIMALAAGLYTCFLSQSRGPWVSIPVLLFVGVLATSGSSLRYRRRIALGFLLALVLVGSATDIVRTRIESAQNDLQQYFSGENLDTSIGLRLQLWHGSLVMLKEHPVVGVGIDGYEKGLADLAERNIITPEASGYQHSHNEFLFAAARLGSLGVLSLAALYLVPMVWFSRRIRNNDAEVRAAAAMGLALCLGFFVLGLSDVVFLWWEMYPFYAIGIAVFAVFIDKRRTQLAAVGSAG